MSTSIERAIQMLTTALDMERKGKDFYEKTISTCQNELGRKIFSMLKKDEDIHVQRIMKIWEQLKGGHNWSSEWKELKVDHGDLAKVFRELAAAQSANLKPGAGDLEALEVGIDFEFRAVRYYEEQLPQASHELEKQFISHMIQEEKDHHQALSDMKFFLADPAAWFRQQEGTAFDGGAGLA